MRSRLREWRETEGEAEFDERETFVGGGEGATKAGFELAGFDPDEIGGEEGFFFEAGAAEGAQEQTALQEWIAQWRARAKAASSPRPSAAAMSAAASAPCRSCLLANTRRGTFLRASSASRLCSSSTHSFSLTSSEESTTYTSPSVLS
jgi:hypothetical protein